MPSLPAGVALAIITVVKGVGTKLNTTFSSVSTALN
jgi:Flp pilus assembly pilin Flp